MRLRCPVGFKKNVRRVTLQFYFERTKCLISGNVILYPVNLAAGESDGSPLQAATIECDFSWLYQSIQINLIKNHLLSHKPASALLSCCSQSHSFAIPDHPIGLVYTVQEPEQRARFSVEFQGRFGGFLGVCFMRIDPLAHQVSVNAPCNPVFVCSQRAAFVDFFG